jgi:intein/homing endonuclease
MWQTYVGLFARFPATDERGAARRCRGDRSSSGVHGATGLGPGAGSAADTEPMTLGRWMPFGELAVGDRVAAPRRVPETSATRRMVDAEVILLVHMIGDGSCVKRQPIRYATTRPSLMRWGIKFCGNAMWRPSPSKSRLHRTAAILGDRGLHDLSKSDVFWDKIVEITPIGEREVYRVRVDGADNVVVNGITVRTS